MNPQNPKIIALIPAYNEEKKLAIVLEAVKKQMTDVLVVDDGSVDQTAEIARAADVHLLSRGYNCGKGQSLKDGFSWALERGYDAVLMLDADGQHDPSCIPSFQAKYVAGDDKLIIGARNYREIPLRRRIPNVIGKFLFSQAVGQEIPDNQSGYRLVDRCLMKVMLNTKECGFHFEVEMIALCLANDWTIGWVEIPTIYGTEKSKQKVTDQLFGFPKMALKAHRLIQENKKSR